MQTYFEHIELNNTIALDNFGFGVFRIDKTGKPIYVNKYMLQLLGFESLADLENGIRNSNSLQKCFDPNRLSTFIRDSQKTFYEYRWTTKSNGKKLLREFGHEVIKNGELVYYDCVVEDVSEKSLIDKLF
ncbi:MAG: PAS domain-containing protein, partial [Ignavibacteria bacterium]|nr:PAS domain-containing protein [Ignavibacteria bacterium]